MLQLLPRPAPFGVAGTHWTADEPYRWALVIRYGAESSHLESFRTGERGLYPLAENATELLVSMTRERRLYDFFDKRHLYDTWQEAFEAVFGLTVESFYEAFEVYREEQLAAVPDDVRRANE